MLQKGAVYILYHRDQINPKLKHMALVGIPKSMVMTCENVTFAVGIEIGAVHGRTWLFLSSVPVFIKQIFADKSLFWSWKMTF